MNYERGEQEHTLADVARASGCSPENIRALLKRGRVPEDAAPIVDPATGTRSWPDDRFHRFLEWNAARRELAAGSQDDPGTA